MRWVGGAALLTHARTHSLTHSPGEVAISFHSVQQAVGYPYTHTHTHTHTHDVMTGHSLPHSLTHSLTHSPGANSTAPAAFNSSQKSAHATPSLTRCALTPSPTSSLPRSLTPPLTRSRGSSQHAALRYTRRQKKKTLRTRGDTIALLASSERVSE